MSARIRMRHNLVLPLTTFLLTRWCISGFARSDAAGTGQIYISGSIVSGLVRVNDMTGAGWMTLDVPGSVKGIFIR